MVAKVLQGTSFINQQLQERTVIREYQAIACVCLRWRTVDAPVGRT